MTDSEFQCEGCQRPLIHMIDEAGREWLEEDTPDGLQYFCPDCRADKTGEGNEMETNTMADTVEAPQVAPEQTQIVHLERKEFKTMLRVELTDAEIADMSQEMADAYSEVENLESEIKTHKQQLQSKIETKKARIAELMGIVRVGYESRKVKCERVFDYDEGVVKEIRLDTEEVIDERPLEDDEKQMSLPGTTEEDPQAGAGESVEPVKEPEKEEVA